MKVILAGLMAVVVVLAGASCTKEGAMADKPMAQGMTAPMQTTATCYACPMCGECATQPGKCPKCGAAMTEMHVLAVKNGTAYLCACPAGCKCTMTEGSAKCSCGKDIVKVSVKGKYVCSGDMGCPMISDKPGKCACGKDLKLVE